jgi:hypothetical protein
MFKNNCWGAKRSTQIPPEMLPFQFWPKSSSVARADWLSENFHIPLPWILLSFRPRKCLPFAPTTKFHSFYSCLPSEGARHLSLPLPKR